MEDQEQDLGSLKPILVPYKIGGKAYVLREADAGTAAEWNNLQIKAAKLDDGKVVSFGAVADGEPFLLSKCVFEVRGKTDEGEPILGAVALSWIKALPARISKVLYDKAIEISGLKSKKTKAELERQIAKLQEELEKLVAEENLEPGEEPAPGESADPAKN